MDLCRESKRTKDNSKQQSYKIEHAQLSGAQCTLTQVATEAMFRLRWLAPLQRLADAHPRFYIGFGFLFLGVPSLACYFILDPQSDAIGICNLVLNSAMCIMMFGFLSSRRYGLDRVAAKHVLLSFRFGIFVALLATEVVLSARRVYKFRKHNTVVFANALENILYCICILLDCSPHLPQSVQICLSVDLRTSTHQKIYFLNISAGGMVLF